MTTPPYVPAVDLERAAEAVGYDSEAVLEMTRDFWRYYFAGQALAGLGEVAYNAAAAPGKAADIADDCVAAADALLAKLESEEAGDA